MSFGSPRGSEWRKCDLHIHTPASICSEYGGDSKETWDRFFEELEILSETVKIIGINDYLFLDGYKKVLEYKRRGGLKNIELILPVIEFRLKQFVGRDEFKRINYHILFADESILTVEQIESQFLTSFIGKAVLEPSSTEVSWRGVVTRTSLVDLGKELYERTPPDKRTTMTNNYLKLGFDNINFDRADIDKALGELDGHNSYLKGNYLKAIGKAEWGDLKWSNDSILEKKSVINSAHIVFSASKTAEQANKNLQSLKSENVNSRLFHCSDAHGFAKDPSKTDSKELGHCFTWIKANSTFEGLKEALIEYELRVKRRETNPNEKISYEVIKEVRFISDTTTNTNEFTPNPILLNPDLNTIIGGKSCGKSLLLYSIANTIDPNQVYNKEREDNLDNSINEKRRDKYSFAQRKIDFEVTWANDAKQLFSEKDCRESCNYSILYLPQSYIQRIADTEGRRTRKELGKIIRSILLQDKIYKDYYKSFIDEVQRLDVVRETLISKYIIAYDAVNSSKQTIYSIGNKTAIEQYIIQLQQEIVNLKMGSEVTPALQETYDKANLELQSVTKKQFELKNDSAKIDSFKKSFEGIIKQIHDGKERLLSEIKTIELQTELKTLLLPLDSLYDISGKIETNIFSDEGLVHKQNLRFEHRIVELTNEIQPISRKFSNREEIEKRERQILLEREKLNKIEVHEKDISDRLTQNIEIKAQLFFEYKSAYKEYIDIIIKLNERGAKIEEGGLKLEGKVKFDTKTFDIKLRNTINLKQSNTILEKHNFFPESTTEIDDVLDEDTLNLVVAKIDDLFDLIMEGKMVLKNSSTKKDALNALMTDEFFDYWEISSGNDEIANMSPGKAGLVLLKLLIDLSDSSCPILIDQPEDNLDNRSIYTDLVQYIRTKKFQRQFIVVTHNPNIVVGPDADNIIVANQNDQDPTRKNAYFKFDYKSGGIEYTSPKLSGSNDILSCMGIREHVSEILEGGEEAFKKREAKYRYNM